MLQWEEKGGGTGQAEGEDTGAAGTRILGGFRSAPVGLVLVQMPENLCGVGGRYIKDHKMFLEGDAFRSDLAQCTTSFSNIHGHLPIPRDDDSVGVRPRYLPMESPWLILLQVVCRAIFEIQHCPCISTWVQIQHSASLTVLAGWVSGAGQ